MSENLSFLEGRFYPASDFRKDLLLLLIFNLLNTKLTLNSHNQEI